MGRGRQKAKQQKVARQLKYFSPDTDYSALQRELTTGSTGSDGNAVDATLEHDDEDESTDEDDEYAPWAPRGGR